MAAVLVTLTQAKAHLQITLPALDPGDVDIQLKLDQAEATILGRLTDHANKASWVSPATAPGEVTAAILLLLARLYEHRGDLEQEDAALWDAINRLLVCLKTPSLA